MEPGEVERLAEAIRKLHFAEATLESVVNVVETFQGQTVWAGPVAVFSLKGHSSVSRCFAWSHALEGTDKRRFVAVLAEGKVDSPAAAVRAAIVQELRSRPS